jgi:hypothetical protein
MRLLWLLSLLASPVIAASPLVGTSAQEVSVALSYYCEESKTVSVGGHSAATPRVCVPVP